jgi:hypothetical protein
MIYRKDANFPYPILSNTSSSYVNNEFILDVQLEENTQYYRFYFQYEIESDFINRLVEQRKAQLILVIQSKDNKFYRLRKGQTYIDIPNSRISILENRTSIQMYVQSLVEIEFNENDDLNEFYQTFKSSIKVPKYGMLGYSNIVSFDDRIKKPFELFQKKLNPELSSDIKIELGTETIIIHYKNEQYQFNAIPMSNTLNNPYIYMGLQKALYRFLMNNGFDGEQLDIDEIEPPSDPLDLKLYQLMKKKMVTELSIDNIDEVIYKISDRIIEKYTHAVVKGISSNGS